MTLAAGERIGPYEILGPLGAGGMGEVYRARDSRLGRDVAIKVLPEAFARDAERLRRFETEARAVAALNHPNIVSVHDIGTHDGAPYLVSECLEGHSLGQELSSGPVPLRRAVEYGTQVAQGLAAAHEKGIIHRDLKPENIFVTQDGRVKILDFGLAKLASPDVVSNEGATVEAQPTSAGAVLGTVGYMSPEQVKGEAADARSDIFALGAILYEMLSGQRAFRRDTSAETMTAILKEDPPELSASRRTDSPAVERIVRRCLEKKPLQRFQSARDLAFNLEGLSGSSSASAATLGHCGRAVAAMGLSRRSWLGTACCRCIGRLADLTRRGHCRVAFVPSTHVRTRASLCCAFRPRWTFHLLQRELEWAAVANLFDRSRQPGITLAGPDELYVVCDFLHRYGDFSRLQRSLHRELSGHVGAGAGCGRDAAGDCQGCSCGGLDDGRERDGGDPTGRGEVPRGVSTGKDDLRKR